MRTLKNKGEKNICIHVSEQVVTLFHFMKWPQTTREPCIRLSTSGSKPMILSLFTCWSSFIWSPYHFLICLAYISSTKVLFNDWLISWELKIMIPTGSSKKKDLHTVHNVCEFYRSNSRPRWYLRIIEAFIAGLVGEECHVAYGHVIPWLCSSRAIFGLEKNIYIYFSCY